MINFTTRTDPKGGKWLTAERDGVRIYFAEASVWQALHRPRVAVGRDGRFDFTPFDYGNLSWFLVSPVSKGELFTFIRGKDALSGIDFAIPIEHQGNEDIVAWDNNTRRPVTWLDLYWEYQALFYVDSQ